MTIAYNEQLIQLATLDQHNQIHFTPEFIDLMSDLDWAAKAFVGHLLGLWYDPFEHMLDYGSGEAKYTADQPGEFDRNDLSEPQDVVEYWAVHWSENPNSHDPIHLSGTGLGLSVDWYRDVLRAKLVSMRLPKRLLVDYRDSFLAVIAEFDKQRS